MAVDSSGDIVHMEVFNHAEQNRIDEFFEFINQHLKYPIKAITTDFDECLKNQF